MNDNPTINDILSWYSTYGDTRQTEWEDYQLPGRGGTYSDVSEDFMPGYQSGQKNLSDYISSLLEDKGQFGKTLFGDEGGGPLRMSYKADDGRYANFPSYENLDIDKMLELFGGEDFQGMSKEDLSKSISDIYSEDFSRIRETGEYSDYSISDLPTNYNIGNTDWSFSPEGEKTSEELYDDYSSWHEEQDFNNVNAGLLSFEDFEASLEGGAFSPTYEGVGFESGDLDELIKYAQTMQEGLGAMISPDAWGLGTKLGNVEASSERKSKRLLQNYIPSETESRYKALTGGGSVGGELAEAEYLSSQFGGQRQLGRDVGDIYGDYSDDVFGRLSDFISNLG